MRAAVSVALLGLAIRRYFDGSTAPIDNGDDDTSNGVATAETVRIGGIDQFVLTRGRDRTKPVLLVLHGGPGDSAAALFGQRCPGLEDHFVVVHWDQRGSGRSYIPSIDPNSLTVDQLVEDCHELTQFIIKRFPRQPIVVLGHSWGTYLGLRLVQKYPADYAAFVGVGQVADQIESERRGFEWAAGVARARGHQKAQRQLDRVGPPLEGRYTDGLRGLGVQRRWVREFGGAASGRGNLAVLWMFAWPLLRAREYRLIDKLRYLQGENLSMSRLQEPMLDDAPADNLTSFEIPIFVIQGRDDRQTDVDLASTYVQSIDAPLKRFVIIEDSAHLVPFEKPAEFIATLTKLVEPCVAS